ncbi:MAG TPA: GatB/YqeY domain-containing protein [Patescibacteria group bacterium]
MTLKEKITSDLKDAMKAGDVKKRDTLRLLDSAIKNAEIEKKKRETGLNDEEVLEVVSRAVKQRQDSIRQFEEGGRPELAEKEKEELEIIRAYMPEQLGEDEIRSVVKEIIAQSGATAADMGRLMGMVMGKLKGKADGNAVRKIVQEELK